MAAVIGAYTGTELLAQSPVVKVEAMSIVILDSAKRRTEVVSEERSGFLSVEEGHNPWVRTAETSVALYGSLGPPTRPQE